MTTTEPTQSEIERPKARFDWNTNSLVQPEEGADEVVSTITVTDERTSMNDDGSLHREAVESTTTTKRRRIKDDDQPDMPKWERDTRDALATTLRGIKNPLAVLLGRDANEGDTRLVINEILSDGLGYDRFSEITTEHVVRGQFVDYGIKIDEEMKILVEVKKVGKKLNATDLAQAESYALRSGIEWLILTNGHTWRVYHVDATSQQKIDMVFEVSILEDIEAAKDLLFYISRASLTRNQITDLWSRSAATSTEAIQDILVSDNVVETVRREIWRENRIRLSVDEVRELIEKVIER